MFEVNSAPISKIPDNDLAAPKKTNKRHKAHSFASLTSVLQDWQPNDVFALRRELINESIMMLEERNFSCIRACIPAIIVDKQYPVDILHYKSEKDIDEFVTRMLWMHQEFNSAIGILLGVPDEETALEIEEAYQGVLENQEDCVVLLI